MTDKNLALGTLAPYEPHPMAYTARYYIGGIPRHELIILQEALSSCAISGSRTAEICGETLRRLLKGEPVSDRYLLGLYCFIKEREKTNETT